MPQQPPRVARCVSYVPLLRGQPGVDLVEEVRRPTALRQILSRTVSGLAAACLWLMQDDDPVPVFVYERGSEIHAHLLEWAENDSPAWFTLYFAELPDEPPGYLVVLQPRIDCSVQRFKESFPPGLLDEATIEVIFSPLYFVGTGTSYRTLKSKIGLTSRLGILDARDFHADRPGELDLQRVRALGPFTAGDMADLGGVEAFLRCAVRLVR